MGLSVWNHLTDPYDHAQLADNFSKLDFHDHTPGRGVLIPTEGIAPEAITADKIAPGVLDTPEIITPTAQVKTPGQSEIDSGSYVESDSVTLSVPEDSLVFLWYGAQMSLSTATPAQAAIFIDGSISTFHAAPEYASSTAWRTVRSFSSASSGSTTGLIITNDTDIAASHIGTPIVISNLSAGVHTFAIKYKRTSGSGIIRVRERVLRVWAQGF